jgi:hypothetical protein
VRGEGSRDRPRFLAYSIFFTDSAGLTGDDTEEIIDNGTVLFTLLDELDNKYGKTSAKERQ